MPATCSRKILGGKPLVKHTSHTYMLNIKIYGIPTYLEMDNISLNKSDSLSDPFIPES
jgi:hypothetical protein